MDARYLATSALSESEYNVCPNVVICRTDVITEIIILTEYHKMCTWRTPDAVCCVVSICTHAFSRG
jgi:hypothetical protein